MAKGSSSKPMVNKRYDVSMPGRLMSFCCGIGLALGLVGCAGERGSPRPALLGPAEMRLNPTFTRIQTGGVTADVELLDAFGDAVKGGGRMTFVLHEYRPRGDDVRGGRVGSAARFALDGREQQIDYWSGITQSYRFELPWARLDADRTYVLEATYAAGEGVERQFDRVILRPESR